MKQIFVNGVSHSVETETLTYQEIADIAKIAHPARISYVQPMKGGTRGGGVLEPDSILPITSAMNFIVLSQEDLA